MREHLPGMVSTSDKAILIIIIYIKREHMRKKIIKLKNSANYILTDVLEKNYDLVPQIFYMDVPLASTIFVLIDLKIYEAMRKKQRGHLNS